jgi:DNA-binding protein HU-beta
MILGVHIMSPYGVRQGLWVGNRMLISVKGGNLMTTAKRMSKAQIIAELAEKSGLSKKDIQTVFTALLELVDREVGKRGPGEFVIPDIIKMKVKQIAARKERKGIDPFTKEERVFPAKPASRKIRATPLKKLKDLIN